jgi:cell division protein FtsI (penicillin-binding protein 3)
MPHVRPEIRPIARPAPRTELIGVRAGALRIGRNRLALACLAFAACFLALTVRLIELTALGTGEPATEHLAAATGTGTERADIVDRNGTLLATNLATASLYADAAAVPDPEAAADRLLTVLPGLDRATLVARLSSKRRFVWLQRHLTPRQQYAVNRLGIPGLHFQDEEERIYPHGRLLAHVLGYTDIDGNGIAGVEKSFNRELKDLGRSHDPLQLSIDIRVQHALRDELARAVGEFHAIGAAGVVLDAASGEVLGLASLPDFDPNHPGASPDTTLFNRATLGVYELGSVFKAFTVAMALDTGSVGLAGGYDATRPLHVARFTIHDDHPKKRWLSVPEILMYSSNIGAAKMALDVGAEEQQRFLGKLGLLRRLSIRLPEVGDPLRPSPWRDINTMTVAFGHGVAVSPLQYASAFSALINGGVLVPPTLLKRDRQAIWSAARPARRRSPACTATTARRCCRPSWRRSR